MIKWEIKITITEFHLIFLLVFGVHLSLLTVKSHYSDLMSETQSAVEKKINEQKKEYGVETEEELMAAIATKKRKRIPFVITYMGDVKVKRHSELLSLLETKVKPTSVAHAGTSSLVGVKKGEEVILSQANDIDFKITDTQKKNLIKRLIKQKLSGVDACKRTHLLRDEFLMGTIKVNMKIKGVQNVAIPKFQGHGNKNVIHSLESCVKGELVSLSFPGELSGEEVTFDYRVN